MPNDVDMAKAKGKQIETAPTFPITEVSMVAIATKPIRTARLP